MSDRSARTGRDAMKLVVPAYLALGMGGCWNEPDYDSAPEVEATSVIAKKVSEGPVYSDDRVPKNYCSRYVRLAAQDMFGINYPAADAWDMRKSSDMNAIPIKGAEEVRRLANEGTFKPGEILAVYNPKSNYNNHPEAQKAGYTHVMLLVDRDESGEVYFADKFGKETRTRISLSDLVDSGLEPREILEKR